MTATPVDLIANWLERQLAPDSAQWLNGRREELRSAFSARALHITLGMIPRRLGKADLVVGESDIAAADAARHDWDPSEWSVTDAARILVLVETAGAGDQTFAERFSDLCRTADVGESVAFYRGLALYPDPDSIEDQAREGLRTNMRAVFEAVAHRNPFPREQFDTTRWNQMVLKALFVDSPLHPIQGLDARANAELAHVLCDYAHERWAAGRPVSPELWRCVGPHATDDLVVDLARALADGTDVERKAAALALCVSPSQAAKRVLESASDLTESIARGELSWDTLISELP
ncbi:MAG: EboA domain-containing protein [Kiloniellales bacterium]